MVAVLYKSTYLLEVLIGLVCSLRVSEVEFTLAVGADIVCVLIGYTDTYCETDIDECLSDPCQGHGSCNDFLNSFNCSCHSGLVRIILVFLASLQRTWIWLLQKSLFQNGKCRLICIFCTVTSRHLLQKTYRMKFATETLWHDR